MKETWHPKEIGVKQMAEALAASIPLVHDRPITPPLAWAQDGDKVTVILADGRKVSASIQEINALMFASDHPSKAGSAVQSKPKPVSTPSKKVVRK